MITDAVLDKILALLAPLFADVVAGDTAATREAARSTLACYGTCDDRALRFAALSIAFSFGALDALSRAADRELPPNQVLRLRGNANALNRAAQQNEAWVEKVQRRLASEAVEAPLPAPALPKPDLPDPDLPASSATADLVDFVRTAWKAETAAAAAAQPTAATQPIVPISRQQRRLVERQAEKQRQREQKRARLAQRAAQREAACTRAGQRIGPDPAPGQDGDKPQHGLDPASASPCALHGSTTLNFGGGSTFVSHEPVSVALAESHWQSPIA